MITICLMNALKIEIRQPAFLHNYVSSQPNHVAIGITKVQILRIQIVVLGDDYKFICRVFLLPFEIRYYNPQEHLLHTNIYKYISPFEMGILQHQTGGTRSLF